MCESDGQWIGYIVINDNADYPVRRFHAITDMDVIGVLTKFSKTGMERTRRSTIFLMSERGLEILEMELGSKNGTRLLARFAGFIRGFVALWLRG